MKKFVLLTFFFSLAVSAQTGGKAGGTVVTPPDTAGDTGMGKSGGMSSGMGMSGGMSSGMGMSDTGGLMSFRPGGQGTQQPLPETRINSSTCSFSMGDEVSADDQRLLTSARNMGETLRNNSQQCSAATSDVNQAFQQSIQEYNDLSDASRPVNPNAQIQATCANYERFYDIQYDQFVNSWNSDGVNDIFSRCRGQNQEDAFSCAQEIVSSQRIQRRNQCETTREFISAQRTQQLEVQSFTAGVNYLQALINNDQCVGEDGQQRMNLLQSAVSIASRAASISLAASPMGVLVSGVTSLLQSAIGRLFRGRDPYLADQNQQNFERVACLYEQIETRSRRCDRDSAEQYVLRERARYESAVEACEAFPDVETPVALSREITALIGRYNPPAVRAAEGETPTAAEAPSVSSFSQDFNGLMERLLTPTGAFGGNQETPMDVGMKSARDVISAIDVMLEEREPSPQLDNYIRSRNPSAVLSVPARNRERQRLRDEKARAENVLGLLTTMNEVGNSSNQTSEDLMRVQTGMRNFNGGELNGVAQNFAGAFNQILAMKSEFTDDLGGRISTWRNRLNEYQIHQDTISRFNRQNQRMSADYRDDSAFQNQINTLRPYLRDQMNSEMRRLLRTAQAVVPSRDLATGRNVRQTTVENILWPMIRACNLLPSVESDNNVCEKLTCNDGSGVRSFAQFLRGQGQNTNCGPQNCPEQFTTYVCQNKAAGFTDAIRERMKNEYVTRGTICGRPWNEVFRR